MDLTTTKEELRATARHQRKQADVDPALFEQAADIFFEHVRLKKNTVIAGYWPLNDEFDPRPILQEALRLQHKPVLPVIQEGSRVLEFYPWRMQTQMEPGPHKIMQPALSSNNAINPDIVIVPLLACDLQGGRIGYGGGYYDHTLKVLRAKKPISAVGICYDAQVHETPLVLEDHDETLDAVITPTRFINFSKKKN